ncbi:hypothetical protein MMMB2_2462 [Mycobacterium marinum MB2]|nr:hypothetical protein MMMB2_2462 [Mycobacterium marinum MB2]
MAFWPLRREDVPTASMMTGPSTSPARTAHGGDGSDPDAGA